MIKIDGKALAQLVKEDVKKKLQDEKYKSIPAPHLIVIQVGDNQASNLYINNKKKACEEVGIKCSIYKYREDITTDKLKEIISKLSLTPTVTGILIQLPLPEHIDERALIDEIDPIKDVDGFTCVQAGLLQLGIKDKHRLEPCTAKGIVRLLESVTTLEGKNVTVIGRSNIVGKPVAQLLQEKNASVTICHSKTRLVDIERNTEKSDIIILATGKAKYFGARYFVRRFYTDPKNRIIIDAGINRDSNGKLCGDLNTSDVEAICGDTIQYTPVPGGVGPMTIAELIDNICIAYDAQFDNIWKYHQMKKMEKENV
jgi:methylenetetrahydrofolate dehydrogenase (NADP+)/methenyltetrahydrofolate cyclohydrolase